MWKHRSVQVFQVKGISPVKEGEIFYLRSDGLPCLKAAFCSSIDEYCFEIDRKKVVVTLMLGGPWGVDNESQVKIINEQIEKIRNDREKQLSQFATIVLEVELEIDAKEFKIIKEIDNFIVCVEELEDAEKEKIRITSAHAKNILLSSLMLNAKEQIEIKKITEGSYLLDRNNNIYYQCLFSLSGDIFSSEKINSIFVSDIEKHIKELHLSNSFTKVYHLLSQAIDEKNDNFRSFIFSWIALEIFINKVFKEYKEKYSNDLLREFSLKNKELFLERVEFVMNGKYRLQDKFIIISAYLDDDDNNDILGEFKYIKNIRDKLFHGDEVGEDSLPVYGVLKILKKYLNNHILQRHIESNVHNNLAKNSNPLQ